METLSLLCRVFQLQVQISPGFLLSVSFHYFRPTVLWFKNYILFFSLFPQLDNPDEQAAQIRRELDGRLQMADQIARVKFRNRWMECMNCHLEWKTFENNDYWLSKSSILFHITFQILHLHTWDNWLHFCFVQHGGRFPRFVSREMEAMYIEELRSSVNLLMANLESMPVSKGGEFKLQKLKRGHNTSIMDMGQEDENTLSKSDVVLSFTLEVGGLIYCVCLVV